MPKVALIMGSKSDWPSLRGCVDVLKGFEIEVEVHVASAHRTPETVAAFAANARENVGDTSAPPAKKRTTAIVKYKSRAPQRKSPKAKSP